jgi:hypothetical protein
MPASAEKPLESVLDGVHQYLMREHRQLFFSVWLGTILYGILVLWIESAFSENFTGENSDSAFYLMASIALAPLIMYGIAMSKARHELMKQVAASIGFTYAESLDFDDPKGGFTFSAGHSKSLGDIMTGVYRDFPMRIYTYTFITGYGKNQTTHHRSIVELNYGKALPHIYLSSNSFINDLLSGDLVSMNAKKVTLEGDFNEHFTLYIEGDADVEVREIFQPDFMQELIEKYSEYRIELSGNFVYIVRPVMLSTRADVLQMHELADKLIDDMLPNLRVASQDLPLAK